MNSLLREAWFLRRQPAALAALLLLTVLAGIAVAMGLQDVARQHAAIDRLAQAQQAEDLVVRQVAVDAGSAGYYRFYATWNPPSPLAFAALGQRDVAPNMLRVRALAIEGQIHESESYNPELALPGRFDFAFVLVYLAPLLIIVLLHDLWSGEREAGRAGMLQALPGTGLRLWGARAVLRLGLTAAALAGPFLLGAWAGGAGPAEITAALALILAMVLFWGVVTLVVAHRGWRSSTNAAVLAGIWFSLTLVLPAAAGLGVNAAIPVPQGAELVRGNREAVHAAWDLDRNATLARFYEQHPEWAQSPPLTRPFHWKWYFAFQQLGDEQVAELSREYRDGIAGRAAGADRMSLLLPPIAIQRALHRLAGTDSTAHLAYQDRVREFHAGLRRALYPYLFEDRPFMGTDWDALPSFQASAPAAAPQGWP